MNGRSRILSDRVAQNLHLARVGVDLDVDAVRAEGVARRRCRHVGGDRDRIAGLVHPCGELGEGERLAVRAVQIAVFEANVGGVAFPDAGGPLAHPLFDFLTRFDDGHPGRHRHATASRHVVVPHAVGVGDQWVDVFGRDAERLGQLHGEGGPRSADVGRAFDERHLAVAVDVHRHRRLEARVEPEPAGDAATARELLPVRRARSVTA